MAKKPIEVIITKGKHKTQPYTVTIDPPGKAESTKLRQRYVSAFTARRGALRHLKARTSLGSKVETTNASTSLVYFTPGGQRIAFK